MFKIVITLVYAIGFEEERLHKSSVEGRNVFVYTHSIFFAFSSLTSCVFLLLQCVLVYIFIKGITCLIVELWTAGSVLYSMSCDLTILSKTSGPMRDPFGKREKEHRAGFFLLSLIIVLARKEISLPTPSHDYQNWLHL